ncbi:MAG: hypothetical protein ACRDJ4_01575 [Actinomycetota bacterium]
MNGVGLTRLGDGFGIKVNLTQRDEERPIPDQVDGVPVRVETVGTIRKQ